MNKNLRKQHAVNSDWSNFIQICMYAHPVISIFLIVSFLVQHNIINNHVVEVLTSVFYELGFLVILLFLIVNVIIVIRQFIRPSIPTNSNLWLMAYTLLSLGIIFLPDALHIMPSLRGSIPT
ncbi:hypothetical protein M8998_00720 [Sphingobacterium sp. lm-10]|uniref:hypothetical protein n=1 Tax=Sphingobacterium sp. lm-10 TaxID=2944904 RepID=UPI0020215F3A|nr:hypothetical protein [Sphingobacterium sp. lm-10]MCL7986452.1 hypothetical protein [Sphingobacterium sp. lm-10]